MNTIQKLKIESHKAVIQYIADNLIETEYIKIDNKYVENKNDFVYRKQALNLLKKYGYNQFLISNDRDTFLPEYLIKVYRKTEDSWNSIIVFNVFEVQEFLNLIQSTETPLSFIKDNFSYDGHSNGPGRSFTNSSVILQNRNRIVVKCSGGLDI